MKTLVVTFVLLFVTTTAFTQKEFHRSGDVNPGLYFNAQVNARFVPLAVTPADLSVPFNVLTSGARAELYSGVQFWRLYVGTGGYVLSPGNDEYIVWDQVKKSGAYVEAGGKINFAGLLLMVITGDQFISNSGRVRVELPLEVNAIFLARPDFPTIWWDYQENAFVSLGQSIELEYSLRPDVSIVGQTGINWINGSSSVGGRLALKFDF